MEELQEQASEREKREMSSLDIRFLVKELRQALIGGMFRKIYQYGQAGTKQLLFEIFTPGKGASWLYVDNSKIFITNRKKAVPQEPPNFCMFLRKHLMGKKVTNIMQYGFDRIVELETAEHILIFELFSPGNVILCDKSRNIIMPLEIQKWKTRTVKAKETYKYPPYVINPFKLEFDELRASLSKSDRNLVAHLSRLGFGPVYAAELCKRAGLDTGMPANTVGVEKAAELHKNIEGIDKAALNPVVYDNFVSPFPLEIYTQKEGRKIESFSEALDGFFSEQEIETVKEEQEAVVEEKREKVETIIERQEEASEKWNRIEKESRKKAELIYNYYGTVEDVLNGINKARNMNMPWSEIKEKIRAEPEGDVVKEIKEGDGIVVVELGGIDVEIDIRQSVEENAARYYEDAKWARKKMSGAEEAKTSQEQRLQEINTEAETTEMRPVFVKTRQEAPQMQPEEQRPRKKLWYEKFKWFFSTDGLLVLGGRDAEQNETLVKRHTDSTDIVFHADIPGAAFVVIKRINEDLSPADIEKIPDDTKKEAAEFSAANSKAWSKGLGAIDVFSVTADRVTKNAPQGEHLEKGSFMIEGEREWHRNVELKLCIGIKLDRESGTAQVVSGPLMAVRKNSDYFVTIKPGFKKALELARGIRNRMLIKSKPEDKYLIEKAPLEDIQSAIPSGTGEIIESARDF